MTTTPENPAKAWRDLADQLTTEQFATLEAWERGGWAEGTSAADIRRTLLVVARDYAQANLTEAWFSHIAAPADSLDTEQWQTDESGNLWFRCFQGTTRQVHPTAVSIDGTQCADGAADRILRLYTPDDRVELSSDVARELAAALIEAADEIDAYAIDAWVAE